MSSDKILNQSNLVNNVNAKSRRLLCTGGSGFIGKHLIDYLQKMNYSSILNLDILKPTICNHEKFWQLVDILDRKIVKEAFLKFQPTHVIHLAAKADMDGVTIDDYRENIEGTRNILEAAKLSQSLQHIIITSTQHVIKPGSNIPANCDSYDPYEAYGQSKVLTEQLTHQANLECFWTIIRPTAVWGPGHMGLAKGLWSTISKGLYVHPRNDTVIRSYGYVNNVVYQILKIFDTPIELVNQKTFYVGDPCISQLDWVNAFSEALTGRRVKTAPKSILYAIAIVGQGMKSFGIPVPIYLSRYKNMITSNPVPVEAAIKIVGQGPYSLDQGILDTIKWLKAEKFI